MHGSVEALETFMIHAHGYLLKNNDCKKVYLKNKLLHYFLTEQKMLNDPSRKQCIFHGNQIN